MASLVGSVPIYEKGVESVNSNANSYVTQAVTFTEPFASTPSIQVTLRQPTIATFANPTVWSAITIGVVDASTTGFTLVVMNASTTTIPGMGVDWCAIGNL